MKKKKLLPVRQRGSGVRLSRNTQLIAVTEPDDRWPKPARRLYARLSKTGEQGTTVAKLVRNRYDRWLTRCLVKAKHIRPLKSITRMRKPVETKHDLAATA